MTERSTKADRRAQRQILDWLDGVDAVATTIYVVLIVIVVGGAFGLVLYLFQHWQPSWGTQGEGFYLVVAFLAVLGWAMGQLAWLIWRRREAARIRDSIDIRVDGDDKRKGHSGADNSENGVSTESSDDAE